MTDHDLSALGAYALDALEPHEKSAVEEHVVSCFECRAELGTLVAVRDALSQVPPEVFLDGPPEYGDVLARTLRAVRHDANVSGLARVMRFAQRRSAAAVLAATFVLVVAALGGAVLGRHTAPAVYAGSPPVSSSGTTAPGTNTRTLVGTNPGNGAAIIVTLTPAAGWVRIHAEVMGIPAGTPCQIIVTGRSGISAIAGSWLVSPVGEREGTPVEGSALVAPADVASVRVSTLDGRELVTATA
jgi:hypothetical protein